MEWLLRETLKKAQHAAQVWLVFCWWGLSLLPARNQPQRPLGPVRSAQTVSSTGLHGQPVILLLQPSALVPPDVHHGLRALSALLHQPNISSKLAVVHPVPPLHGEPDGRQQPGRRGLCAARPALLQQLEPKHPSLQAPHPCGLSWGRRQPERSPWGPTGQHLKSCQQFTCQKGGGDLQGPGEQAKRVRAVSLLSVVLSNGGLAKMSFI